MRLSSLSKAYHTNQSSSMIFATMKISSFKEERKTSMVFRHGKNWGILSHIDKIINCQMTSLRISSMFQVTSPWSSIIGWYQPVHWYPPSPIHKSLNTYHPVSFVHLICQFVQGTGTKVQYYLSTLPSCCPMINNSTSTFLSLTVNFSPFPRQELVSIRKEVVKRTIGINGHFQGRHLNKLDNHN